MVIQRIQTLMLIIAIITMAIFCCTPFAESTGPDGLTTAHFATEAPALLTLNILVAALLFIIIFMYKNLRQQMRMTLLALTLIGFNMVTCGFIIYRGFDNATPILFGGVSLLVLTLLFVLLAYRSMSHDRRLLASADRLR